ncbi:MAG: PorP/SprF family type IX secretion system membrane protein [Fluviicola sp.]|jgi:type IX secretion system PorP/SprF family membrane protein
MKKYIYFITLLFVQTGFAQQQGSLTNFLVNPQYYSSAYVGSTNYHEVNFMHRSQWVGFNNAPKNSYVNFHGSYKNKAKHGYGLSFMNEATGLLTKTGIYLNYGYQMKLNSKWKLGLGVRPGLAQYRIRFYDAVIADAGDQVLSGNSFAGSAFDVASGFRLYSSKIELAANFDHFLGKGITFTSYNQNLRNHFSVYASYIWNNKKNLEIKPTVLIKYTKPVPVQTSVLVQATYKKIYSVGLSFRTDDAIGLFFGYRFKERLYVTYGYDYSYTDIRKYNAGSHEFGISYILTKKRPSLEEEDDKLNNSILEEINKNIELQKEEQK